MKVICILFFAVACAPAVAAGGSTALQALRFSFPSGTVEVPLSVAMVQKIEDNTYLRQLRTDIASLLTADNPLVRQTQMVWLAHVRQNEHEMLLVSYEQAEERGYARDWQEKFDRFGTDKIFPWQRGFIPLSKDEWSLVVRDYPRAWRELRGRYGRLMELKTDFYREAKEIHQGVLDALRENRALVAMFGAEVWTQTELNANDDFWVAWRGKLDQEVSTLLSPAQLKERLQQVRAKDVQEMLFLTRLAQATVDPHEAGMLLAMYRSAILQQEELLYPEQGEEEMGLSVAELWKDLYTVQRKTGKTLDHYVLKAMQ